MDLSNYSEEDLILSAFKSEVDAKDVYSKLAERVKNYFLKEKLNFLAQEEDKHRLFFEGFYKEKFPGKEVALPEKTPVPLPEIQFSEESIPLSEILESAMKAESAAHDFYLSMAERYDEGSEVKKTLQYFATMEMGHYKLLEIERKNALDFEQYDQVWPMMHAGP
jgi:rubrerythrin